MSKVHSVLSSVALLGSCRLRPTASFRKSSISYLDLLFLCYLLFFPPALLSFSKSLPSHGVSKEDNFSFVLFCLQESFWLICSEICWFIFLVVQGLPTALPTTTFQNNQFFFPVFFTVQVSQVYIVIGNVRVWVILAFDTSLSLVTFPNSPIAAFQNLSLPFISWLQSPLALTETR